MNYYSNKDYIYGGRIGPRVGSGRVNVLPGRVGSGRVQEKWPVDNSVSTWLSLQLQLIVTASTYQIEPKYI